MPKSFIRKQQAQQILYKQTRPYIKQNTWATNFLPRDLYWYTSELRAKLNL